MILPLVLAAAWGKLLLPAAAAATVPAAPRSVAGLHAIRWAGMLPLSSLAARSSPQEWLAARRLALALATCIAGNMLLVTARGSLQRCRRSSWRRGRRATAPTPPAHPRRSHSCSWLWKRSRQMRVTFPYPVPAGESRLAGQRTCVLQLSAPGALPHALQHTHGRWTLAGCPSLELGLLLSLTGIAYFG